MNKPLPHIIAGVLFDLDGTLLDSAPDMYAALLAQCAEEGIEPPPYPPVRQVVSRGARAVLRCAFGARGDAGVEALMLTRPGKSWPLLIVKASCGMLSKM